METRHCSITDSVHYKRIMAGSNSDFQVLCLQEKTVMAGAQGLVCIFAVGKNKYSHQFLNWWQQQSTGPLRFTFFKSSAPKAENTRPLMWSGVFWQGHKDLN